MAFGITAGGSFTLVYDAGYGASAPSGALIQASDGNFYGVSALADRQ